jgi:fatty-acid desaturase
MILDANQYRVNIPAIASLLKDKTQEERVEWVAKLAIITGVPICITAVYVGELFGFTPELTAKLQVLKAFYHVTEIVNIQPSNMDDLTLMKV